MIMKRMMAIAGKIGLGLFLVAVLGVLALWAVYQSRVVTTPVVDCVPATAGSSPSNATPGTVTIKADVWVDNWFAFYLGEQLVKEDSVSITTERSFNKESFTFEATYPLQLNFIVKDYKANDTGLEYIGTDRQQMGDGGFIAQFTDVATCKVIAVTNEDWKGLVIHKAPLDIACAKEANPIAGQAPCTFTALDEPAGWKAPGFDEAAWSNAILYTTSQVDPKLGYDEVKWDPAAKLIWGPDLKIDNTILYRLTVPAP